MSFFELFFESGERSLSVRHFRVREAISTCFEVEVEARSPDAEIDLDSIVGRPAAFRAVTGYRFARAGSRFWTGLVNQMEQVRAVDRKADEERLSTYRIRIVPPLWLLTQRCNHRIFQHLSIPDIIDQLLADWDLRAAWKIDRPRYPKLEYKVQYGESDYAFFSRLLEEAGIAFTFPDDPESGSVLTLGDALQRAEVRAETLPYVEEPSRSAEMEYLAAVRLASSVQPGSVTIRDYDFRKPTFALFAEAKSGSPEDRYEQYHYHPGALLIENGKGGDTPVADDKGIARYDLEFGKARAGRALRGERVDRREIGFETNAADVSPGVVMAMSGHPHPDLDEGRHLLVTELTFQGSVDGEWLMGGRAVFIDQPYRPAWKTPKPAVYGVQSATVVGPAEQEIHTDEFGRVRVQFPWDRQGRMNDTSSCWIRVSQGWAGTGFGMINLPRIGQEVLIGFLAGDPDQPIVVGRVFNAIEPVNYRLPDNKTQSGWKSDSSPHADGGFNEIQYEDLKGEELLDVQAEKNQRTLVKNDETITVGRHLSKRVVANETETTGANRTEVTGANRSETTASERTWIVGANKLQRIKQNEIERTEMNRLLLVEKDQDIVTAGKRRDLVDLETHQEVLGDRRERIFGKQSITVEDERHEKVGGRHALATGTELHMVAGVNMVGEASDVTIKGPGGFIRIDGGGVTIVGNMVKIQTGGGPGSGSGAQPKKPEEPKPAPPVEPRIIKELTWSKAKVPVGEMVEATFQVEQFAAGDEVIARIYERDADGNHDLIDTVRSKLEAGTGQVKISWVRGEDQVQGDLDADESEGENGPLEYHFDVSVAGVPSPEISSGLRLTNTITIDVTDDYGVPMKEGTKVELTDGEKTHTATTNAAGQVEFEGVLVGPVLIEVAPEKKDESEKGP